jgi:hypothetical protein
MLPLRVPIAAKVGVPSEHEVRPSKSGIVGQCLVEEGISRWLAVLARRECVTNVSNLPCNHRLAAAALRPRIY